MTPEQYKQILEAVPSDCDAITIRITYNRLARRFLPLKKPQALTIVVSASGPFDGNQWYRRKHVKARGATMDRAVANAIYALRNNRWKLSGRYSSL